MGQSDIPLNEKGLLQAEDVSQRLQGYRFSGIYSSDLRRAMKTAEIIAAGLHLPVNREPRLREINQGEWEGLQVEIIKARYAVLWQQRSSDPASIRPPGGETVGEVAERVRTALDEITRWFVNDSVLIVSHGLALATVLCTVRGIPVGQAYGQIPVNAEPIWVDWKKPEHPL
jgi:broad specificity phosphatase PhoE